MIDIREQGASGKGEEEAALVAQATDLAARALEIHQQPGGSVVVPEALRPNLSLGVLNPLT